MALSKWKKYVLSKITLIFNRIFDNKKARLWERLYYSETYICVDYEHSCLRAFLRNSINIQNLVDKYVISEYNTIYKHTKLIG